MQIVPMFKKVHVILLIGWSLLRIVNSSIDKYNRCLSIVSYAESPQTYDKLSL
jgi:hypothetical protein